MLFVVIFHYLYYDLGILMAVNPAFCKQLQSIDCVKCWSTTGHCHIWLMFLVIGYGQFHLFSKSKCTWWFIVFFLHIIYSPWRYGAYSYFFKVLICKQAAMWTGEISQSIERTLLYFLKHWNNTILGEISWSIWR